MKLFIFVIFYIFTSIFNVSAKTYLIDNIVAIVNDQVILNSDVNQMLDLVKNVNRNNIKLPLKNDVLKDTIINQLIINSLIWQEANKMNIIIDNEQIQNVIKNIALEKNISVKDFKKHIFLYNKTHPHYYNNYIKNIVKLLKIQTLENYELHKRVKISPEEVKSYFKKLIREHELSKKINVSYIFLPIEKEYSNEKISHIKDIAQEIKNKMQKGYDFKKLLIDYKTNNYLLVKKMLWMSLFDIHEQLSEKLKITKKGEIFGPCLGSKGFYVLKINDISLTDPMITQFHIKHILIKSSNMPKDLEDKKKIFSIYKNINQGKYTFNYALEHFSNDFGSSDNKGDLGWVSKEFFNMHFSPENFKFNNNNITHPIKSSVGWHIFKLLDTRKVDPFDSFNYNKVYNILLNYKKMLAKKQWIKDLKRAAYIKIIN